MFYYQVWLIFSLVLHFPILKFLTKDLGYLQLQAFFSWKVQDFNSLISCLMHEYKQNLLTSRKRVRKNENIFYTCVCLVSFLPTEKYERLIPCFSIWKATIPWLILKNQAFPGNKASSYQNKNTEKKKSESVLCNQCQYYSTISDLCYNI